MPCPLRHLREDSWALKDPALSTIYNRGPISLRIASGTYTTFGRTDLMASTSPEATRREPSPSRLTRISESLWFLSSDPSPKIDQADTHQPGEERVGHHRYSILLLYSRCVANTVAVTTYRHAKYVLSSQRQARFISPRCLDFFLHPNLSTSSASTLR